MNIGDNTQVWHIRRKECINGVLTSRLFRNNNRESNSVLLPSTVEGFGVSRKQFFFNDAFSGSSRCLMSNKTLLLRSCRILRSVLLSAAVIGVRPVLIIEVGTLWRQVKGIKSYLTLSRGSRSHVQTVHLWMSLC